MVISKLRFYVKWKGLDVGNEMVYRLVFLRFPIFEGTNSSSLIRTFLLITALFFGQYLLGQDGSFQDWQENLYEIEKSKDLAKTIDKIDELDKYYFNDIDRVVFELVQDETFRFMFAKRLGWKQVVHQEAEDQLAYFYSEDLDIMTGKEITDMFGLRGMPEKSNPFSKGQNSSERFEEVYVLRAKDEPYAVVVHVHNYPNGNMTSWYTETRYYFLIE